MDNKNAPGSPRPVRPKRHLISSFISLLLVGLMIMLTWSALKVEPKSTDDEYYQVVQYFDEGKITEYNLNIASRKLTYVLKGEKEKRVYSVPSTDLFIADIHNSVREYNKENPDKPIKMNYEYGASGYWLAQLVPMIGITLVLAIMLYWAVKKMSNTMLDDTKRSMAFGKARLKTGEAAKKTTFEDVAGLDEEKEDLEEIVEFLKNPQKFSDLGARIPKGVILVGPPGTGKTLLARAVAGEADATFLSISGSDFVEMYVGVGASRVRDLFDNAKKNVPSIVFIDEIDAVGRHRGAGMGGGHDEREQTLNQLLVEMDGFGENTGVIVMAATNRPDILDPALLRPGRFDRQITVNYPDVVGREAILKVHARNKPIGPDVNLGEIARATSGFTGADLENLLNEAALLAARRGKKAITKLEIEEATIKVVVGTEKKSKKITDDEKKLTAYHESGHAITNYYLDRVDPVHQISIIPRGMAGGYTMSLPKEDKSSYVSKKQMLDQLVTLLGGRVAEALVLGDISTGASNDIERATSIARSMITKYGMSDKLGPITYGSSNDEVFLGKSYNHVRDYSETTASAIDKEVELIITEAYDRADDILRMHVEKLHLLANYLMRYEKIDAELFEKLMSDENTDDTTDSSDMSDGAVDSPEETAETPAEEPAENAENAENSEDSSDLSAGIVGSVVGAAVVSEVSEGLSEESAEVPEEPAENTENSEDASDMPAETVDTLDETVEIPEEPAELSEDQPLVIPQEMPLAEPEEDTAPAEEELSAPPMDSFDAILESLDPEKSEPEKNTVEEPTEPTFEPKEATESTEVVLTESELRLKRELDRENGLISAEDEYAFAELEDGEIDDADISDYIEEDKKPDVEPLNADVDSSSEEPAIEGLTGAESTIAPQKADTTPQSDFLPGMEDLDIGGFFNNMSAVNEEEKAAIEKVLGKRVKNDKDEKGKPEELVDDSPAPDEVSADFDYAKARESGTFTENDEIYALYELLKATHNFSEEDDGDWKSKMKDE